MTSLLPSNSLRMTRGSAGFRSMVIHYANSNFAATVDLERCTLVQSYVSEYHTTTGAS